VLSFLVDNIQMRGPYVLRFSSYFPTLFLFLPPPSSHFSGIFLAHVIFHCHLSNGCGFLFFSPSSHQVFNPAVQCIGSPQEIRRKALFTFSPLFFHFVTKKKCLPLFHIIRRPHCRRPAVCLTSLSSRTLHAAPTLTRLRPLPRT